jgi:hypothetical protein
MASLDYGRSRLPELLESRHMTQAELISGKSRFSLLTAIPATEILRCKITDLYEWKKG